MSLCQPHARPILGCFALQLCVVLLGLLAAGPAWAGQSACTPTTGYTVCWIFTYSGADQSLSVPPSVSSLNIRAFGAAGGGANSSYWTYQGGGAGGGYAAGNVAVTGGSSLTVVVGQGGQVNSAASTYGGGGGGGTSTGNGTPAASTIGGSGGGLSGVFLGSKSAANALVIAGGGGGTSPGADNSTQGPGGGGGTTGGQDAVPTLSGRGGSPSAGGAAATTTADCSPVQGNGSQFQGGAGGGGSWEGGGGGGGGWYGGGGGRCQSNLGTPSALNLDAQNGGGGGGSSYLIASATGTSTIAGANFVFNGSACSGTAASGGAGDSFYAAGIGLGSCFNAGGNGMVVVQYNDTPTLKITAISQTGTGTFSFTGSNGFGTQAITTVSPGTGVSGPTQTLAAASTATTITETPASGYVMTAGSCTGLGSGGTATINVLSSNIVLDAAATAGGAAISCSFTNAPVNASLSITKTYSASPLPVQAGQVVTYSYAIANTGNVVMTNIKVKDMHGSPATQVPLGPGGITNEVLTTAGPYGAAASPDATANDGIWTTLAPGATVTFTWSHIVTQAEIDHG